jgi:hypothetical protein
MKLRKIDYIRLLRIILFISAIVLFIKPIKTTAEEILNNNSITVDDYIELGNNDVLCQTFICDVYQLRYMLVTLNMEEYTMMNGSIELSLYLDGSLISKETKEIEDLKKDNQIGLDFPNVGDSYGKECYLEIIYFGDDSIKLKTSELINTNGVFKNDKELDNTGIEVKYVGNKNNYFLAWYPILAFALVSVVFSVKSKGD